MIRYRSWITKYFGKIVYFSFTVLLIYGFYRILFDSQDCVTAVLVDSKVKNRVTLEYEIEGEFYKKTIDGQIQEPGDVYLMNYYCDDPKALVLDFTRIIISENLIKDTIIGVVKEYHNKNKFLPFITPGIKVQYWVGDTIYIRHFSIKEDLIHLLGDTINIEYVVSRPINSKIIVDYQISNTK
jgi:hypothetical protein